jgi:hypothetical protein
MRLGDSALLVDDVGDPFGVFVFRRTGGAVGDADLAVGVAEQGEGEVVNLSAKRALASTSSKLAPRMVVFFASYCSMRSRNPEPSAVQPGVSAFG